jgi:hypothetical protein
MSNEVIGLAAGKVWEYLEQNGPSSPSKVVKALPEFSEKDINRAIGWLAREDKLAIEFNGRAEQVSLK